MLAMCLLKCDHVGGASSLNAFAVKRKPPKRRPPSSD